MDEHYKEVYFHKYCADCKYRDVANTDEPCNECLSSPINLHSHKPVCFDKDT